MSIGRISTAETYGAAIRSVNDAQSFVSRTQEQLGAGKRILKPSDDPIASAQIDSIRNDLSRLTSYQTNISRAQSDLALQEGAVQGVGETLQRARELVIQALSPARSGADLASLGDEIDGLLDRLVALGNTQNAGGDYIFAGFASRTRPYEFDSDGNVTQQITEGELVVNVAPGLSVLANTLGEDVFNANPGNGGFAVSAATANTGTGVVNLTRATPNFDATLDYRVEFSAGGPGVINYEIFEINNEAVTPTAVSVGTGTYAEREPISFQSGEGSVSFTGRPEPGDVFNITSNLSTPRAEPGSNGLSLVGSTLDPTSTAEIDEIEFDRDFDDRYDYQLVFTSPTAWQVTATAAATVAPAPVPATIVTTGTYVEGEPITIATDGASSPTAQVTISGTPVTGDTFDFEPNIVPRQQSAFQTLIDIRDALLRSDNDQSAGRAKTDTVLTQALQNLDNNLETVTSARTSIGTRLLRVEGQQELNDTFALQLERNLGDLESLDFAEAISNLQLQLVALQAAQQTFVKTTGLTLFNFL